MRNSSPKSLKTSTYLFQNIFLDNQLWPQDLKLAFSCGFRITVRPWWHSQQCISFEKMCIECKYNLTWDIFFHYKMTLISPLFQSTQLPHGTRISGLKKVDSPSMYKGPIIFQNITSLMADICQDFSKFTSMSTSLMEFFDLFTIYIARFFFYFSTKGFLLWTQKFRKLSNPFFPRTVFSSSSTLQ